VVDEHGVVVGLVTLEDVIEELIGDFEDESDRHNRRCRRLGDTTWALSGDLRPDELAERTGIELPEGDWETVAGFVIAELGRVPDEGDVLEMPGYTFDITRLDGYAVDRIRLRIVAEADGTSDSSPLLA
jgi:CBS domain containing-hemolysin-like protein